MTERVRLEVPLLLPEVDDAADACVTRLMADLRGRSGIRDAHVVSVPDGGTTQLCLHYDPDEVTAEQIRAVAHRAGAEITDRFGHLLWNVEGMSNQRRARTVEETILRFPGVLEASANVMGLLRVEFDRAAVSEPAIEHALRNLGVHRRRSGPVPVREPKPAHGDLPDIARSGRPPQSSDEHDGHDHKTAEPEHGHTHGGFFGERTELYFSLICGALLAIGFAISVTLSLSPWIPRGLYIAAYAFGGFFTLREAVDSLKLRRFEIDTLMLVAAAGAAALDAWAEGALLLFLFSFGHALEHYAMGRAKRAIEALAQLAPRTATVRRGAASEEVPVESLAVGDVVVVKPNERLPADGFVVEGSSSVNQAPITGESVPIDKRAVENPAAAAAGWDKLGADFRVFAGTINGAGLLAVQVSRLTGDTTLARIVKMVGEAEAQKSPTQRFTDKFERVFVPAILGLVVLLMFAGFVVDEPFRDTFYRAMAVLVAASPCALAIATPSAVLSGVARAARGGVLVKGGGPLESLGSLAAIAFDKTGTLTEGRPRLTDVVAVDGASEAELLATAVAVERLSDHPLASAIVRDGADRLGGVAVSDARNIRAITGRGVEARVDDDLVHIGRSELFVEAGGAPVTEEAARAVDALLQGGRTIMIVRRGDRYLGVLGLMDTPREAARATIKRLRDLGIRRMIMISGDSQIVAEAIAREVGLDEAWGDLMPEDKVAAIQKLKAEQKVAMVGDGVNDAPAMAHATVGIAMGAAGSDVALETADVALMADDLAHLPFAVGLSRQTSRIIRQNLYLSLGVVALLLPATIFGLGIGPAVLAHEGSTLVVVFNALRLLAYRKQA